MKGFYPNINMDDYEYMWIPGWIPPQYFIDENQVGHIFINNRIFVEICKGMYGLPKSGELSYIAIIKNLQLTGYTRTGFTPGLFKHATQDTI